MWLYSIASNATGPYSAVTEMYPSFISVKILWIYFMQDALFRPTFSCSGQRPI